MKNCPVCRAPYRGIIHCTRCKTDLYPLLSVRNDAIQYYNRSLAEAREGHWSRALAEVDQAIQFFSSQADFYLLKGKVLAHLGQFLPAYQAWQDCLRINSTNEEAMRCLHFLEGVGDKRT